METFTRGDLVFDVSDTGPDDGEVVVLLHGFPQNRHAWDTVAPRLAGAGYRVLAPDQRGYSPRARPAGRRSYVARELVDDVLALIDALGREQVHVVGHDWGASVAWALASSHPERVRSLTAVSVPHPAALVWAMPRGQALRSWYMALFQLPALPEALLRSRVGQAAAVRSGLPADVARRYVDTLGPGGVTAALNWYRAVPFGREAEFGHRIAVRTLYVWSDGDTALGRQAAQATARYVTGPYRFEVLEGVGHWIPETAPDRLTDVLLDHLAGG